MCFNNHRNYVTISIFIRTVFLHAYLVETVKIYLYLKGLSSQIMSSYTPIDRYNAKLSVASLYFLTIKAPVL